MAGDESNVITKGEQLLADGFQQGFVIAFRKIRASDGAAEQHITDKGKP